MTKLIWDETGQRYYETAVSKGVFYQEDGTGVIWNGLTAIDENGTNQIQPVYFDGVKINDVVNIGDFNGVLRAFTYPDEFLPYEGIFEEQLGFFITDQPGKRFGLSYQTKHGNDIEGLSYGYKIHIIYNLTAVPATKTYATLSLDTEPIEFEWAISAIPEEIATLRPTSHIIFDSTKMDPWMLQDLEDILYGDADSDAHLPTFESIVSFIRKWDRLIITDNGDGTWTADAAHPGYIEMLDATTFAITAETAIYLDAVSYEISSTDKNEEDVEWQQ